jgi:adenosylcobinamide-GDP ribazoletransferase
MALLVGVLATGGLHEDGLADLADGFGGGRTRERKLEIMRDSRIGSYSTLALILCLGLLWQALASLPLDITRMIFRI